MSEPLSAAAASTSSTLAGPPLRARMAVVWLVRLGIATGLGLTVYLVWIGLTGQSPAGCGLQGGFDCDRILATRWSWWLQIPVSVAGCGVWLMALLASLTLGPRFPVGLRRAAGFLVIMLAATGAVAGLWFMWLQANVLRHYCVYCQSAHITAFVVFMLSLGLALPAFRGKFTAVFAGLILGAAIPAGQLLVPAPPVYRLDRVENEAAADPLKIETLSFTPETARKMGFRAPPRKPPRRLVLLGGKAEVDVNNVPIIGSPDAEFVVVTLYDYDCFYCRELHAELLEAQKEYHGRLAIVCLPAPLSKSCNKHVDPEREDDPTPCQLATLAMFVWRVRPEKFAEYDAWLFGPETPPKYLEARRKAVELVTEDYLTPGEWDASLAAQLQLHADLHALSPAPLLPQVHSKNVVLSEQVDSVGELLELLEREFQMPAK